MTKRTSSKYKINRRMGENIWGRPKSPINRREYGPGQHGKRHKARLSDFGLQLRAKQKLKGYYGDLTEKQFRRIYAEASRVNGDIGENLIGLLERRLDAVVYRAKFVPTIFAARQFVDHGHVTVNGKRMDIPSYRVHEGDVVAVGDSSKQLPIVLNSVNLPERDVPNYIEADHSKMTASFVRIPVLFEVPYPVQMEPNLVVEFYSVYRDGDKSESMQEVALSADVFGQLFRGQNAATAIDQGRWNEVFEEAFNISHVDGANNSPRAKLRSVTDQAEPEAPRDNRAGKQ